jgi:hypothetical protein
MRQHVNAGAGDPSEALRKAKPQPRQTLESFVYDFFLQRLGVRSVVEAHLRALTSSCQHWRQESRMINLFGRLLGLFEPIEADGVDHFLNTLSRLHAECGPLVQDAFVGHTLCDCEKLSKIARAMFKGDSEGMAPAVLSLSDRIRRMADTSHMVCFYAFWLKEVALLSHVLPPTVFTLRHACFGCS